MSVSMSHELLEVEWYKLRYDDLVYDNQQVLKESQNENNQLRCKGISSSYFLHYEDYFLVLDISNNKTEICEDIEQVREFVGFNIFDSFIRPIYFILKLRPMTRWIDEEISEAGYDNLLPDIIENCIERFKEASKAKYNQQGKFILVFKTRWIGGYDYYGGGYEYDQEWDFAGFLGDNYEVRIFELTEEQQQEQTYIKQALKRGNRIANTIPPAHPLPGYQLEIFDGYF
jgi:hypothetical protein